ncbi:MAG: nitrilase-related carbon-nitrogen hydrolase [Pseudomonadota bacterium]
MKRVTRRDLIDIATALAIGGGLWFVVNLDPLWWLAWILPGVFFWLALSTAGWTQRGLIVLAGLVGACSNFSYLLKVMPLLPAMIVLLLQALLWLLVLGASARVVKRFNSAWTVLALPVIAVAADTLLAHLTPDGNWGSLAYTQSEMLPIVQIAAVFGVGGILFLLMLVNSAVGLAFTYGTKLRGALPMYLATVALVAIAVGYGFQRLQAPIAGTPVNFGLASLDDFIVATTTEKSRDVWAQYDAQVLQLAGSGAKIVLLPEKIAVMSRADADARKRLLGDLARAHRVWLVAGVGVDDGKQRRNEAWWYAPDGTLKTNYLKHFMAPPEREFVPGSDFPVNEIDGVRYGVAICKDMHFASLGRAFGARDAAVMLVPAWDFYDDARMAANMTKLRGVENGFAVIRSSRDGLLSVSDAYGRMLAVEKSADMPGTTLFATAIVGARLQTIYTRIGDLLGWICVAAAVALAVATRRKSPPSRTFELPASSG